MKITFLGTGTSTGVPTIGCACAVCRSNDPRNKRRRASIYVQAAGQHIIIDTPPDFRDQVLTFGVCRVDAVLITHAHADHCGASAALRERLGVEVALSRQEAEFLEQGDEVAISLDRARAEGIYPADYRLTPCTVDRRLSHGDEVRCGHLAVRAIEVGGHSPGSICYFLSGGQRPCLFSGDTVFPFGTISLLNCEGSSLAGYRRDIGRLANLGVEALLPGHGGFCLGGGQHHIDQTIDALKSIWPPKNYL